MKTPQAYDVIKKFLEKKKSDFPSYSLRALARDVNLSPSYLSKILSGKKEFPIHRLDDFVKHLHIDDIGQELIKKSLDVSTKNNNASIRLDKDLSNAQDNNLSQNYEMLSKDKFFLLSDWTYLAIMDLVSCANFKPEITSIAKRLGISMTRTQDAVERLFNSGCLFKEEDGAWKKNIKKIRFPNNKANPLFRNFHRKTMVHSIEKFQEHTRDSDFEKRLLSGMFVAGNPENFSEAKKILNEAIFKASEVLQSGEPTEVYHIGIQAIPWTKLSPEK